MDVPGIDTAPDTDPAALQALRGDSLYFNVAGSGPTFPVAQDAAERFRRWLNEVGMFSHVDAAGIVTRMWTDERIVVKHLLEPQMPEAIRLSFWALHREDEIERLCAALARQAAVPA